VNVASRLCNVAGPGEVIVSETTMQHVGGQVAFENREPVVVKGKSKPLLIFRALGMQETGPIPSRATHSFTAGKQQH
jgi:adenylate cyclase